MEKEEYALLLFANVTKTYKINNKKTKNYQQGC